MMESRKRATPRILIVGLLAPGVIAFVVGIGVLISQIVSGEPDDSPAAWFLTAILCALLGAIVGHAIRPRRSAD
ncbi:MAG TPA: hypothetical protein VL043_00865 [Protaetiibacter sp.]|nr:hypothetical protein [Protaetiibacter sp.]